MMDNRWFAARLRPVIGLVALVGVLALSACGGGGGAPAVNQNVPPPATGPGPQVLTVLPGQPVIYAKVPSALTVTSGTAPYHAFSSNTTILPVASTTGGNSLVLLANAVSAQTTVTLTIQDSVGSTVLVPVIVNPELVVVPPPLIVVPPTVDAYAGVTSQIGVFGGVPPYRAFSSNSGILPVTQNVTGNAVPLNAAAVAANTNVTITILDSVGQVGTVAVTVHPGSPSPPPALVVLPTSQDAYSGIPTQLTVTGGVPPYRAFSTNTAILPVTQNVVANTIPLLAANVSVDTLVTIAVQDSVGQTVTVPVTVHAKPVVQPPALIVLPTTLDAFAGIPTQITVVGGVAPYRAFTTNSAILPVTQSVTGNTVPLLAEAVAANTPVTVTILDSVGQIATVAVTVHAGPASPPPALLVQPTTLDAYSGIATQLTVSGGVPPYRAFSTNSAVLPVTQAVSANTVPLLAATVTANTNVTITVQDSVGQTVTVPVVVHPKPVIPPPALVVLPTAIDAYSGIQTQITVVGGVAPYSAFSTNSAVLPVNQTVTGNTIPLLAVDVSAASTVLVTVVDSVGQSVVVTVTVHPRIATPAAPLVVLPTDLVVIPGIASRLTISGGLPPYRAFSTNTAVLPVDRNVSGRTILLVASPVTVATPVVITIQDSVGQTVNVNATVRPAASATPPPLVVLPADITVSKGVPFTLTVSGGAPPFFAYSSNPGVLPVALSVQANSLVLTANGVSADTNVIVTVQDSAGQTTNVTVDVKADSATPPPPLTVLPGTSIVFSGVPSTLLVSGGVPPYLGFSSNSAILPVTQAIAGNVIPLFAASVAADTTVTITVQDSSGQKTTTTASVTVRPAPLLNTLTITPNLTTCGTNAICSGQDGTAVVSVQLPGGGPAAGRQERFEAVFGPYGIAQTGSGATLPSQTVTSDSAGHAQVIIKANVDAPTQFAQIRVTDVTSGQQLIGNFLIVQSTDGSTILTVVPNTATITDAFKGFCSFGFRVDYFIYGGTPPYRITHAFPDAITLLNPTVDASGGFFEVVTNGGCVQPDTFSIVDATGRQTTATLNNVEGTNPVPTPPVIVVPDLVVTPDDPPTQATCNPGLIFPFVVTGGTPPYNIFASPRLGTSPTITPSIVNFSGGETDISNVTMTIDVSFVDSTNPKKTLIRRITCTGAGGGGSLLVAPNSASVAPLTCVGAKTMFTITGGVPPYTVRPAVPQQATVAPTSVPASGGTFVVTTLQNTNTGGSALVFIVVTDSQGAQFSVNIVCP